MGPADVLTLAEAIKDPVLIAAATWAALELRALRRHVGRLFTRTESLESRADGHETRITLLEARRVKSAS